MFPASEHSKDKYIVQKLIYSHAPSLRRDVPISSIFVFSILVTQSMTLNRFEQQMCIAVHVFLGEKMFEKLDMVI